MYQLHVISAFETQLLIFKLFRQPLLGFHDEVDPGEVLLETVSASLRNQLREVAKNAAHFAAREAVAQNDTRLTVEEIAKAAAVNASLQMFEKIASDRSETAALQAKRMAQNEGLTAADVEQAKEEAGKASIQDTYVSVQSKFDRVTQKKSVAEVHAVQEMAKQATRQANATFQAEIADLNQKLQNERDQAEDTLAELNETKKAAIAAVATEKDEEVAKVKKEMKKKILTLKRTDATALTAMQLADTERFENERKILKKSEGLSLKLMSRLKRAKRAEREKDKQISALKKAVATASASMRKNKAWIANQTREWAGQQLKEHGLESKVKQFEEKLNSTEASEEQHDELQSQEAANLTASLVSSETKVHTLQRQLEKAKADAERDRSKFSQDEATKLDALTAKKDSEIAKLKEKMIETKVADAKKLAKTQEDEKVALTKTNASAAAEIAHMKANLKQREKTVAQEETNVTAKINDTKARMQKVQEESDALVAKANAKAEQSINASKVLVDKANKAAELVKNNTAAAVAEAKKQVLESIAAAAVPRTVAADATSAAKDAKAAQIEDFVSLEKDQMPSVHRFDVESSYLFDDADRQLTQMERSLGS